MLTSTGCSCLDVNEIKIFTNDHFTRHKLAPAPRRVDNLRYIQCTILINAYTESAKCINEQLLCRV